MFAIQNCATEWSYGTAKSYADPFNDVTLDVVVAGPDGEEMRVPAFWAGGGTWRVRFASPKVGRHTFRTVCSDADNADLHGREGELEVAPYEGDNPLLQHGPLRVSANRRYLEHLDGTPFLWLADTWWMGLCRRLGWPGDFQRLTADRVAKGFSVVQIVAGLYPDMGAFDERGANEAGFPWEGDRPLSSGGLWEGDRPLSSGGLSPSDYARVNPRYFDMADLRIAWLVEQGLVPCVVGCWGYHLPWLGIERMKQHWRTLIARWGACPVVWCLAGEGSMPYYLSEQKEQDSDFQKQGWTELGSYVREIDPYRRPVTIHPSTSARDTVADPSVLDFDMLQTGHGDRTSLPNTVRRVTEAYAAEPTMPVLDGEVCYEGIGEACRQEVQRLMFWACMLSGACGHTYGANGIWQVNAREQPYGPSPHGMAWGHTPWDDAMQLPGSGQLGLAKRLLERFPWWQFEPHPEWVEPHWTAEGYFQPYAAGVPGQVRIVFLPWPVWGITVRDIEPEASYRAFLFNPASGEETDLGAVEPDEQGAWRIPLARPPIFQDWVLVLEAGDTDPLDGRVIAQRSS